MAVLETRAATAVALRPACARDAELMWRWRGEWSVRRFQPLLETTPSQLRNELAQNRLADLPLSRGAKFQWVVLTGDRPAGWITLMVANWEHGLAELGYALATVYQGRGLMSQALCLALAEIFHHSKVERIEAHCTVDNLASRRVLEKNGFRCEGLLRSYFKLRGKRVDNYLYALLRSDYLSGQ